MLRTCQLTDSHCGPAVIQMLLSHIDVHVSQNDVVDAADVCNTIQDHGMRVSQMAKAVQKLSPHSQLWYKTKSTIENLQALVIDHQHPVGVNWQGTFDWYFADEYREEAGESEDDDENEDEEEHDYGHYSIVTNIDLTKERMTIVDPFRDYSLKDRIFPIDEFTKRWWDEDDILDPHTNRVLKTEKSERMMFIVTPKGTSFPKLLGMKIFKKEELQ
jgi:hypothetical protein